MIFDADGHVAEPMSVWTDYLDKKWYPQFHFDRGPSGIESLVVEQHVQTEDRDLRAFSMGDSMTPRGILPGRARHRRYEEGHPGGAQPRERLKVHDDEGVDGAVLFTTFGLWVGSVQNPGLALAVSNALNRWLADYCSVAPLELFGVATLSPQDPESAAGELRRCVEEHGFVAGTIRPNPTMEGKTVAHPSLYPIWETAQDLGVPICLHSGSNGWQNFLGRDRANTPVVRHIMDHAFEMMAAFGAMYESGLFERFPTLGVGFMESSASWAPFWLDRLDEHVETWGFSLPPEVKRLPSEVFRQQCAIGGEGEEPMLPYVQDRLGSDRVMWASDFPHFDCQVPGLTAPVQDRNDLTDEQRTGFLAKAAIDFYHLDGPTIENAAASRRAAAQANRDRNE
jgi:predicted TIM-barrel fold metal-dependent hydrolase